ncbi:MAG: RluA family pseudouridine synthase [Clostridia bacterium]|nr:RluA family pseudouridine synthase [Clostridia bacterium]
MEEKIVLTANENIRCDKYVAENLEGVSRSYIKNLFDDGKITVNGQVKSASYKLKAGDVIEFTLPEAEEIDAFPEDIPLDIVYEDEELLVINKERGMVVHPAPGNGSGTLVNAVLYHCKGNLSGINGKMRPGIVHRIDKDTTGLLVVAKTNDAHMFLSDQLGDRSLSREYYALVHGNIKEDEGRVDAPIARSENDRKKMTVTCKNSREAITDFFVEERFGLYTLVRCKLKTGRTHQIRVHMKHIGHPIAGDKTYGVKKEEFNLTGQLLHAGKIGFIHPKSKEKVQYEAALPEDFKKVLDILHNRRERED